MMNASGQHVIDELQYFLGRGVRLFPNLYYDFLNHLKERERAHKLCLLPSSRFELYHMQLERRAQDRINTHRRVA